MGDVLSVPVRGESPGPLTDASQQDVWLFRVTRVEPSPPSTRQGALLPVFIDPTSTQLSLKVSAAMWSPALDPTYLVTFADVTSAILLVYPFVFLTPQHVACVYVTSFASCSSHTGLILSLSHTRGSSSMG